MNIDALWEEYWAILDYEVAHQGDQEAIAKCLSDIDELVSRADGMLTAADADDENDLENLKLWLSTLHFYAAQLAGDLGRHERSISSYRKSLTDHDDLERRVFFIKALVGLGEVVVARQEIVEIARHAGEFSSNRDPESAGRLLQILCNDESLSTAASDAVIRDCVRALSIRGSVRIVLDPSNTQNGIESERSPD